MSLLSILAPYHAKSNESQFVWGVISILEDYTVDPQTGKKLLGNKGKWFWFPSMYIPFSDDRFWRDKHQGVWYTPFELTQFYLFADKRDKRVSMIIHDLPRLSSDFGRRGDAVIVRGDTFSVENGMEDTDGDRLPSRWQLV